MQSWPQFQTSGNCNNFQFVTRCPVSFSKNIAARVTKAAYEADAWIPIGSYREADFEVV